MRSKFVLILLGALCVLVAYQTGTQRASAQTNPVLIAMCDYGHNSFVGALAVADDGGIYVGTAGQWTRVRTAPGRPASCWRRLNGETFIAMQNGDVYLLLPDYSLVYDSNVFGYSPTPTVRSTWGSVKVGDR